METNNTNFKRLNNKGDDKNSSIWWKQRIQNGKSYFKM